MVELRNSKQNYYMSPFAAHILQQVWIDDDDDDDDEAGDDDNDDNDDVVVLNEWDEMAEF